MEYNLRFSGHETFICKQFWLKKGFDYSIENKKFADPMAVCELGVGKNMVNAINFYSKSFGIIDNEQHSTKLGEFLFGAKAADPYLEDICSLWLLHYNLVSKAKASIYYLVFNEFTRERNEFTKEQLHNFLKRKCFEVSDTLYNPGTINRDINIFLRNYLKPKRSLDKFEVEEDFTALLLELELISKNRIDGNDVFKIENKERRNIPHQVFLYAILDRYADQSISLNKIMLDNNSPGRVFCLNHEGLYAMLSKLTENYADIIFTRTAGNEILQIGQKLNKWEVLSEYYKLKKMNIN